MATPPAAEHTAPATAALEPDPVLLDPERIHAEDVGASLIVECVEDQPDVVVTHGQLVALGHRRDDGLGLAVIGTERHIQRVGRDEDPSFRPLRGWNTLGGIVLGEPGHHGRVLPDRLVDTAVDPDPDLSHPEWRLDLHEAGDATVHPLARRLLRRGCARDQERGAKHLTHVLWEPVRFLLHDGDRGP